MAVTKAVTTITLSQNSNTNWAATDLANIFRTTFIGAGLMTEWFSSFTGSGFEHRILEVTYDTTTPVRYRKTYYWFIFDTVSASVATCSGWDPANNRPRGRPEGVGFLDGSPYLDWAGTDTAGGSVTTKARHYTILSSLSTTTVCSITRYSSGGRNFFLFRSGNSWNTFTIDQATVSLRDWYKAAFVGAYHNGFWTVSPDSNFTSNGGIHFTNRLSTRRAAFGGGGYGTSNGMRAYIMSNFSFQDMFDPIFSSTTGDFSGGFGGNAMPNWLRYANSELSVDFSPVFNGIRPGAIYNSDLPSDFGITALRGASANTMAIQDNVVVTPGTEEYEVLSFQNRGAIGQANSLFLARTVG